MISLKGHLYEVCSGGWPVMRRKIRTLLFRILKDPFLLLNGFWAIPGVFLMRCLRPWRTIRLGSFRSERISHFTFDAGYQWAMRQHQSGSI